MTLGGSYISIGCLVFLFLFGATGALGQLKHGTVVVFSVSRQRVIVAADSRALSGDDPPNDHICKIRALGDRLLFAGAGVAGESHTRLTSLNWDVSNEATRAFLRVHRAHPQIAAPAIDAILNEWIKLVRQRYTASERRMLPELLESTTSDVILDAVFIGSGNNAIEVREASISFDRAKAEKEGFAPIKISQQSWQLTDQPVLKVTGHYEIAYEFSSQSSARARTEAQRWNLEMLRRPFTDQEAEKVFHLVAVSIEYAPYNWGIGGEIDEAEVTPSVGVRWLHKKQQCSATKEPSSRHDKK